MPGDIRLHLTFLSHTAAPSVARARLYFFKGMRELCDIVSCRGGGPCEKMWSYPVILVKSMKNHSWCFTTTESQIRNSPVPCSAKLFRFCTAQNIRQPGSEKSSVWCGNIKVPLA